MTNTFLTSKGNKISVADNSIGDGGEGKIYPIVSSHYKGYCVKLYSNQSDPNKRDKRQKKIEFMIKNPPTDLMGDNYIVCWPKETVFLNKQFVGFIMPLAFRGSKELYELCTLDGKGLFTVWQQKYDRETLNGMVSRMKLCTNLAASIHRVHSLKKYIFADMKPQNILVTDDSKVSLIDLDSIQVSENSQIIFPASVSTPEYEPPEATSMKNSAHFRLEEDWDRFSMAVIFYQILFGIHPYTASFSGQYQKYNAVSEHIAKDLFVHGSGKNHVDFLPPPHKNFHKIPYELQNLFIRAFKDSTRRPSAEEFGKTFFDKVREAEATPRLKKPNLLIPSPVTVISSNLTPTVEYASIKLRVLANIFDIGLFALIALLTSDTLHGQQLGITIFLIYFIYSIVSLTTSWQATLGKKLLGIKVTDYAGNKLTTHNSTVRKLIFIISLPFFILSVIIMTMDKKNRSLHDLTAGTIVVRTKRRKP